MVARGPGNFDRCRRRLTGRPWSRRFSWFLLRWTGVWLSLATLRHLGEERDSSRQDSRHGDDGCALQEGHLYRGRESGGGVLTPGLRPGLSLMGRPWSRRFSWFLLRWTGVWLLLATLRHLCEERDSSRHGSRRGADGCALQGLLYRGRASGGGVRTPGLRP